MAGSVRSRRVPLGRTRRRRRRDREDVAAAMFLAPSVVGFLIFTAFPVLAAIALAFYDYDLLLGREFNGLENFRDLLHDDVFRAAFLNTVYFTLGSVPLSVALGLGAALLVNQALRGITIFRTIYLLPYVTVTVAVALVWRWIYLPDVGLFNTVLSGLHLPTSAWTQDAGTAMISLVFVSTWANMGGATIIYLAGLQNIPGELYEAAEIDGAGVWQRLRHVTLPQMRFLLLVMLLLQIIATMQVFIEPYQLTGTTTPSTITVMILVYRYAFTVNNDFGLAAAMSVLLFVVLGLFSAVYLRITRGRTD